MTKRPQKVPVSGHSPADTATDQQAAADDTAAAGTTATGAAGFIKSLSRKAKDRLKAQIAASSRYAKAVVNSLSPVTMLSQCPQLLGIAVDGCALMCLAPLKGSCLWAAGVTSTCLGSALGMTAAEFQEGGGWHGYDVIRLYTNIDLQDLTTKLSAVLDLAWRNHTVNDSEQVVMVFQDTFHGCKWYNSMAAVHDPVRGYGPSGSYNPSTGKGMYNSRSGKDAVEGKFYVFSKSHAVNVLRLLVENSYVCFGEQVFKQTRGIPMGINPAVYMANYYLFYYEYMFVKQLVDLVVASSASGHDVPTQPTALPVAELLRLLRCTSRTSVDQHSELHGMAAKFLLHLYRCTVRFVDDFTSGPNPFTAHLLYESQSLLGGLIHGIYPGQFLVMEATPGDGIFSFSTLDVRIVTRVLSVAAADGSIEQVVKSYTILFDKRRLTCYAGIPTVQVAHVASTLSMHCGYNILIGQLHRFRELITVRGNYILECARLMLRMQRRGYRLSILRRKLQHHIKLFLDTFGDVSALHLYKDIMRCVGELTAQGDWEVDSKHWTGLEDIIEDDEHELEEVLEMLSSAESDLDYSELEEVQV